MKKGDLIQDKMIARELVREALDGNTAAKFFISQSQRALILIAIYELTANRILQTANHLSLKGQIELGIDGKMVANRLKANAKLLRYAITEGIRSAWSTKGEQLLLEGNGILQAKEIVSSPFRLRANKQDIQSFYQDDSRFFLPNMPADDLMEKKILYQAKHTVPIFNETIPSSVLEHYGIISMKPHSSFFLNFFTQRFRGGIHA
jgi:hypothetical protein